MYVANVGDSMIVMGSRDVPENPNQLPSSFVASLLTIDHKPDLMKERKRIEKSGGWYVHCTEVLVICLIDFSNWLFNVYKE